MTSLKNILSVIDETQTEHRLKIKDFPSHVIWGRRPIICAQSVFHLWLVLSLTFLSACSKAPQSGPADIVWDRDACEQCRMLLGERHYAAQVRGGVDRQTHKFDDLGCALLWLEQQSWKDETTTEIWVADYLSGAWLDARRAYYVAGQKSPMDYGFGAVANAVQESLSFDAARESILQRDGQRHRHQ